MSRQTLSYRMPLELVAGLYSAVISLLLITLINGIPTPKDSHYFVSRLPFYLGKDEQIITLYGFLRAPIYELIDWIYWNPLTYSITTFLGFFSLIYIPFYCLYRIGKNFFTAFLGALFFLPVVASLSALPVLGDFLSVSFPIHFGYQLGGFTTRALTGILFCLIIYAFHRKQYKKAILFLFVSFLCHPNNAVSMAVVMFFTILGLSMAKRLDLVRNLVYWTVAVCLGILPAVLNMQELQPTNMDSFSAYDWYQGLLYDEGDDFSAIFYAKFYFVGQLQAIFIPMMVIYTCKKLENEDEDYLCLYILTAAPVFGYIVFAFCEIFVQIFGLWQIMELMIPSQLGMKVIELSYFPMVFCLIIIMTKVIARYRPCV